MVEPQGWVWLNEADEQYEMEVEGRIAVLTFHQSGDVLRLIHTGVPMALEGQGVGRLLLKQALEDIRQRGLKVKPVCSFVTHYFEKHPEVSDLLAV